MSYAQPLSNQVIVFICGVGFGVLLGLTYEVFTVLRMLLSDKKWAYILCDGIFSVFATIMSFFFMVLFNSGIVRFNLIAAQLLGGVCFHLTIGKYLIKPLLFLAKKLRKLLYMLCFPIRLLISKARKIKPNLHFKRLNRAKNEKKPKKERKKFKNIIKTLLKKRKK